MKIWSTAKSLAEQTPPERNRYVDFLRAVSITFVIVGHWLIATAWMVNGEIETGHLLKLQTNTHWLTWLFQVMPIFFIVGGYSNAVSLESAARKEVGYAGWLVARLNRLVAPLLVLLIAWGAIAIVMQWLDVHPAAIQYMSQASLIPTWFLAIYIMIVILAPLAWRFWRAAGFVSFWAFAAVAVLVDLAFFKLELRWLGWSNYFWVWLAVHQLGFAWRDNRLGGPARSLFYAAVGFATLYLLVTVGPYPLAMVGSPDPGISNTLPPKVTLIALGILQFGVLLALQGPAQRMLSGVRAWAATVLVNSMIMTLYLWHITVMIVFGGLLYLGGGFGFGLEPGTTDWWLSRPLWIAVLIALLVPTALLLSPLERQSRGDRATPSAPRQIGGAMLICLGVALLAMYGYGGGPFERLDLAAFLMVIAGCALSGLLPKIGK